MSAAALLHKHDQLFASVQFVKLEEEDFRVATGDPDGLTERAVEQLLNLQ
jgi:hypothetical protein